MKRLCRRTSASLGTNGEGKPLVPSAVEGRSTTPHVVAIDYGSKRNIFRNLVEAGARVTILPATASFEDIP